MPKLGHQRIFQKMMSQIKGERLDEFIKRENSLEQKRENTLR
jgi:hypothetical protein